MAKISTNISIDAEVKAQAQELFSGLGIDLSTAINIFLKQAVRDNGFPFTIGYKSRDEMLADVGRPGDSDMDENSNETNTAEPYEGRAFLIKALNIFVNEGKASCALLQRKMNIGYRYASTLVEKMEDHDWIGPPEGAKPRKVLISKEEYERIAESWGK
ncbi:MAG: type II toxin-antitoxin system RelB/DinJ family antitoxin [Clostridiales bacterium]|nr:type II toxin-antitoxin system RelB/DinJ family antitoxin [Clostridiales bacterium]